jgi:beta-glucosidase
MSCFPILPKEFKFGAATAAFQIEGGWNEDGKGLSTWDTFMHQKKFTAHRRAAEFAVDAYHDFQTDINLLADLEMNAYRFSIAWSRVLPTGKGPVSPKGLDYYQQLVDALLEKGITPFVTIFHWDMPQALEDAVGGFMGRDCAYYYADYAETLARALGDRVKHWITLNEPWEHAMFGHLLGEHAPGIQSPWAYFRVAHHELLGHGLAVERIRAADPQAKVGITLSQFPVYPFRDTPQNQQAAHFADLFVNRFYLDGLYKAQYPQDLWKRMRLFQPDIQTGDMEIISRRTDFLGVNYYSPMFAYYAWYIPFLQAWIDRKTPGNPAYIEDELLGPGPYPSGLYELAMRYRNEYGNPTVYITENGTKCQDKVDGTRVHDPYRQRYLKLYLEQLARAIQDGADIRGYFVWSLMDLNEWANGYTYPMGLIHVDHTTQQRKIKDSAYWYRDLIQYTQGANSEASVASAAAAAAKKAAAKATAAKYEPVVSQT